MQFRIDSIFPYSVSRIITLTTDFGTSDGYVAAMKGVLLQRSPGSILVDVSHLVEPHDIMGAAFTLLSVFPHFPAGTVHLVVVDPGVGSSRKAIALSTQGHFFVGPDNGLFSLLLRGVAPDEVVQLDKTDFWRVPDVSPTFHGRDIFAPVAAHLSAGAKLSELGSPVESVQQLHWVLPIADDEGLQGWIVHVDRFGNGITNIPMSQLEAYRGQRSVKGIVGSAIIRGLHTTYSDVAAGEPLILIDSSGFVEIAVHRGHAASLLGFQRGDPVNLLFQSS